MKVIVSSNDDNNYGSGGLVIINVNSLSDINEDECIITDTNGVEYEYLDYMIESDLQTQSK